MFCYVGIHRSHCGFKHHAQVLSTLCDVYNNAGYEIRADPIGVQQRRSMDNTTGTAIPIVTGDAEGLYSGQSHISFPNTHVLRGIGLIELTLHHRSVVLGADYAYARTTDLPRDVIARAVASTPPLCMYRHGLWGGGPAFPAQSTGNRTGRRTGDLRSSGMDARFNLFADGPYDPCTVDCRVSPFNVKTNNGGGETQRLAIGSSPINSAAVPIHMEPMDVLCEYGEPISSDGQDASESGRRPHRFHNARVACREKAPSIPSVLRFLR